MRLRSHVGVVTVAASAVAPAPADANHLGPIPHPSGACFEPGFDNLDKCLGTRPGFFKEFNDSLAGTLKEICSRGIGLIPFVKPSDVGCED